MPEFRPYAPLGSDRLAGAADKQPNWPDTPVFQALHQTKKPSGLVEGLEDGRIRPIRLFVSGAGEPSQNPKRDIGPLATVVASGISVLQSSASLRLSLKDFRARRSVGTPDAPMLSRGFA